MSCPPAAGIVVPEAVRHVRRVGHEIGIISTRRTVAQSTPSDLSPPRCSFLREAASRVFLPNRECLCCCGAADEACRLSRTLGFGLLPNSLLFFRPASSLLCIGRRLRTLLHLTGHLRAPIIRVRFRPSAPSPPPNKFLAGNFRRSSVAISFIVRS